MKNNICHMRYGSSVTCVASFFRSLLLEFKTSSIVKIYFFFRSTFFISHRVVANAIPSSNRALCICKGEQYHAFSLVDFFSFGSKFPAQIVHIHHDVSSQSSGRSFLNRNSGGKEDKLMEIRAEQPSQSAAFAICNG